MKTLELDITFGRDYLTNHFGIDFGPDYFQDVQVRAETDVAVKKGLFARFGNLGIGDPDPPRLVRLGFDDTLSVSLMFGGELRYGGGITWVEPGSLPAEAMGQLECPAIKTTWPHTLFQDQFAKAVSLYGNGSVIPPGAHGILETAIELRGSGFLEDLLLRPTKAEHLLDVLMAAVIAVKEFWDGKCYGTVRRNVALGGCSTTTLSPGVVRSFLVPRYQKIASRFGDAFMCSCGESTHNLENFAAVPGARYVRVGWGTDFTRAAAVLHDRHLKPSLSVFRVASQPPAEVAAEVVSVLEAVEPVEHTSLLMINSGSEMPDANVRAVVETVVAFAEERRIELRDTPSCALSRRSL